MPICRSRVCQRDMSDMNFIRGGQPCKGCRLYREIRGNEGRRGHPLEISQEELLSFYGESEVRSCHYCGIEEKFFVQQRIPTASIDDQGNPRPSLKLGIDRIDSNLPYRFDNIVICCLVCNRIKSSIFSHDEMIVIGKSVNDIWNNRR